MESARKLQLPGCSGVASGCVVTTVAEEGRRALRSGVALLGPKAGCRLLVPELRRTATWFGICCQAPATMSAARESHPHGVKRSASPDDDVNNNGGMDEG